MGLRLRSAWFMPPPSPQDLSTSAFGQTPCWSLATFAEGGRVGFVAPLGLGQGVGLSGGFVAGDLGGTPFERPTRREILGKSRALIADPVVLVSDPGRKDQAAKGDEQLPQVV